MRSDDCGTYSSDSMALGWKEKVRESVSDCFYEGQIRI
jgi:hypothetical protein